MRAVPTYFNIELIRILLLLVFLAWPGALRALQSKLKGKVILSERRRDATEAARRICRVKPINSHLQFYSAIVYDFWHPLFMLTNHVIYAVR